jgi:proteasome assembly chaperone (PAC2) family protein
MVDPNSAREVIKILGKLLGIKIDLASLDMKAKKIDRLAKRIRHVEKAIEEKKSEDLRYIG